MKQWLVCTPEKALRYHDNRKVSFKLEAHFILQIKQ